MHRVLCTGLVAAVVMTAAACSDLQLPNSQSKQAASDVMSLKARASSNTVPDIYQAVHTPASGNFVGALVDISAHTCEQGVGGWRVTGTATNPTSEPVDYRIFISLVNGVSTTRALVETEVVAVAAGGSEEFDTPIAMPETDLHCVLRVERRKPGA